MKENFGNLFPAEEFRMYENDARKMLTNGIKFLKFSDILEDLYMKLNLPARKMRYLRMGLGGIFLYNLFFISDYLVIHGAYKAAWTIRLIVITPILVSSVLLIYFKALRPFTEQIISFLLIVTACSYILITNLSNPPDILYYQSSILLILIYGNNIIRLRFLNALVFSIAVQLLYTLSSVFLFSLQFDILLNSSIVLSCAVLLTLVGNYHMDKEMRKGFLLTLLLHIDSQRMEESNRELKHLSLSDPLTSLANRRYFDSAYEQEWRAALRRKYALSLIFLDIDFFKLYNDNYGHQAGDDCLKNIGGVLKRYAQRPHDICARYGGEEFVILLPQTSLSNAIELAERIRISIKNLAIPHNFSLIDSNVTVSLGVAEVNPALLMTSGKYLIEQADKALYIAKRNGRNRVCTHLDFN